MKTNIITLRVSDELKSQIEVLSYERRESFSDTARFIFGEYFNSDQKLKVRPKSNSYKNANGDILQTLGFAELIFWLFNKRENPEINETDGLYKQFIELINDMDLHEFFNDEILCEFKKVSNELTQYLLNNIDYNEFEFSIEGSYNSFNYDLLADFIYTLRYDDKGNRILNID